MFNVESISELKKISQISKDLNIKSNISLRINPDISAGGNEKISTGKAQDKFGIDWKSTIESYDFAASLPGIKIIGIDFHIGSQINEIKPFEESLDLLVGIISELRKKKFHCDQEWQKTERMIIIILPFVYHSTIVVQAYLN